MKRLLFLLVAMLTVGQIKAQFFDFGFSDPYQRRQQVQQVPVTPPSYKGGNQKLNKFIEKKFRNPKDRKSVDGKVVVACIISTKGKVIESQIVQGLTPELNDEAIRVAKLLKFKPAKQGKKAVKSRFDVTFPIKHGRLSFLQLETIEV